ncbi:MAG TPA: hypothetical protein VFW65_03025 [Pseudonocardiaceae bacterium]|nr:hypothetical protein [Pseudonocardiaceae bacterium]
MTTLIDRLGSLFTVDDRTVHRGRYVSTTLLIDAGDERALVTISEGRVTSVVDAATRVLPGWRFALRAPADEWAAFWEPLPRPGSHDLFALLRRKQLRVEGDLHPFMSNLLYFKALLALPRAA